MFEDLDANDFRPPDGSSPSHLGWGVLVIHLQLPELATIFLFTRVETLDQQRNRRVRRQQKGRWTAVSDDAECLNRFEKEKTRWQIRPRPLADRSVPFCCRLELPGGAFGVRSEPC